MVASKIAGVTLAGSCSETGKRTLAHTTSQVYQMGVHERGASVG